MTNKILLVIAMFLISVGIYSYWSFDFPVKLESKASPSPITKTWEIKSIDTMKYSRDLAYEKLSDETFDKTIDMHMKLIKDSGANYVAIGTPYDDRFNPILKRWVEASLTNDR